MGEPQDGHVSEGFGSTYEGLKPETSGAGVPALGCFGSTYEGLKLP